VSYRVAVAVSGRGSNLASLCDAVRDVAEIVLVLSDREAPALELARSRDIPTHRLQQSADGAEWLRLLDGAKADLLVLAGYLRLVPAEVVAAWRGRIINIHPALLPKFGGRGMYGHHVHEAVIASGDAESGATVHLVDEVYDRGPLLGQARVPVLPGDTPQSLASRVLDAEHRLLPAAVRAAAMHGRPVRFDFP
jgi:formyltetrahydrofolate-dependent phosphoribosylglycinamide formyltransferase